MNKITDIEEKTIQITYFLSRNKNKDKFSIENIYRQWCSWWKEDFNIGILQPEVYNEQLVLSRKGAKLGEIQPEFMDDFNKILLNAQKWMNEKYDENASRRTNSDRFKTGLLIERKKNYHRLKSALKKKKNAVGYHIVNRTSDRHPCWLGRYVLHNKQENNGECCCTGTYDEVLKYIYEEL